jgi:Tfp pilus assembly protein PilN
VKNIDFLPDIYRHQRALRHTRLCWMGVGVLFGLAIAGAASGQWYFRSSLAAQLKVVEPRYAISQSRKAEIEQLQIGKKVTQELAALYFYLKHPWPRTQLLAAVAQPMPSSIRLTDLLLVEQADTAMAARGPDGDTNHLTAEAEKGAKPTAKSVLAELRREHDRQQTILELSGEAMVAKELHEYVDSLAKSPLFASASLNGLESGGEAKNGVASFHIRIVVRPGYGQPGTPSLKSASPAVAMAGAAGRGETGNSGGSP